MMDDSVLLPSKNNRTQRSMEKNNKKGGAKAKAPTEERDM